MTRRLLRSRAGFSLTELIIAMLLSSFVMIGIVGISAQMVRFQVEGMKKGSVTGWSLVAITAMNKEIEDGTVLAYPTNATGAQDTLIACKNYSRVTNAALSASEPILTFGYCYDSTAPGYLRRWTTLGSCPAGVPTPPTCSTISEVVATGVYRDASNNFIFRRADDVGGVQIRYRVGNPTPTTNMPMPQTMAFDMKFAMNKQYNNTAD
ncbi:MAG: prepilin-type N-terminal cleavage/methylation domain-containing protein [Elusimicrobiota bacterium]|nr:prepilin-type N-terminal cleavage/methylation domain-containing protein [Elusimicrobiota bacterium]